VGKDQVAAIASQLREGDFVNVISTRDGEYWASHVGLVVLGPDGERHFLHSSEPQVREETFESFIARAVAREERNRQAGKKGQVLAGFKFLRLNDDIAVPPMAPQPRPGA
jgi:bifunctional DNA-binding transcriptional regulator/antitoxin component of YhaV-PrlF toxin-antitoxin module